MSSLGQKVRKEGLGIKSFVYRNSASLIIFKIFFFCFYIVPSVYFGSIFLPRTVVHVGIPKTSDL